MDVICNNQDTHQLIIIPFSRKYCVGSVFITLRIRFTIATYTMDSRVNSIHGNRYWQVFAIKSLLITGYPIAKKGGFHQALLNFIRYFRAPYLMLMDGSPEQTDNNSNFQATLRKQSIPSRVMEPYRPYQNPAERTIGELRNK